MFIKVNINNDSIGNIYLIPDSLQNQFDSLWENDNEEKAINLRDTLFSKYLVTENLEVFIKKPMKKLTAEFLINKGYHKTPTYFYKNNIKVVKKNDNLEIIKRGLPHPVFYGCCYSEEQFEQLENMLGL